MARKNYFLSEKLIEQRIKDGRGQGYGEKYQPWLRVQDVPSDGRSHRIFSHKTKRIHHLLSDLELATFLLFDWSESVLDIREQFPLIRDDTRIIAQREGIKHPVTQGVDLVMTTDFLIDAKDPFPAQFAVQVKYQESFKDPRTIEKLDLERCYWQQKGIPWVTITEQDIDVQIRKNIEWLYSVKIDDITSTKQISETMAFLPAAVARFSEFSVIDACKHIDLAYELELGQSLRDLRLLMANRLAIFDIRKPVHQLKIADIKFMQLNGMEPFLYVENQ